MIKISVPLSISNLANITGMDGRPEKSDPMKLDSADEKVGLRVLITGIGGFIGRILGESLEEAGYEVWGFSRNAGKNAPRVVECDLKDPAAMKRSLRKIPRPDVVIHAAHLENEGAGNKGGGTDSSAPDRSLLIPFLQELEEIQPLFILLGSVAVYGERRQRRPQGVRDEPRPTTEYGRRKLNEERALEASALKNYLILRLTPVYNEERPRNLVIRARPWPLPLKLFIFPEPRHSLCHTDTLLRRIVSILHERPAGRGVSIVGDLNPYGQHQIARQLSGIPVPLPVILMRFFYPFLLPLSGTAGESIRGYYWKLFQDTVFE